MTPENLNSKLIIVFDPVTQRICDSKLEVQKSVYLALIIQIL